MDYSFAKVLLLGENERGSSYLQWQLENRGCHCWFAHSTREAGTLYQEHTFDLILSTAPLSRFDAALPLLANGNCKIYQCRPEEDSCWWLPVAIDGQKPANSASMRPSEFLEMLDKMFKKRQTRALPPQRPLPLSHDQAHALKAAS